MLKIYATEIAVPLQITFLDCSNSAIFPDRWKFANVQPIYKKSNRQMKNNYRPISLLPICGKILEKIVFDQVYAFLSVNNLLSQNQSGFRPGDSSIFQLISITSTIYDSFEKYDETRAVFLDISKAFYKVWHEGIIFKLKCNGISGNLLNLFENYLLNSFQRVVLSGNETNWTSLKAGVPKVLFWAHSFFLFTLMTSPIIFHPICVFLQMILLYSRVSRVALKLIINC